jgi:hypothetical protein
MTKLEGISEIKEVHYIEQADYESYPAAVVDITETESDYGSTKRRMITYGFQIRIYYKLETNKSRKDIEIILMNVHDKIVSEFKDTNSLEPEAFSVMPIPTKWVVGVSQEATYRIARLNLDCQFNLETNN